MKAVLAMLLAFALLAPASAEPPQRPDYPQGVSSLNPGSDLWREVRQRDLPVTGTSQVQGVETGVLINAQGDRWARFRVDNPVRHAPKIMLGVCLLILVFYLLRGKVGVEGGLSGRMVHRFTDYERILHWCLAIVFLFLALTGLALLLGRTLLIPLLGHELFSLIASASKEGHNLFGPIFLVSLLLMLVSFARRNIYEKGDLTWLLKGGGFIGKGHVSGGFFNMCEKSWYWMVILVGLAISISGMILLFPNFGQGRVIMALSHAQYDRLRFIRHSRELGFSLERIRQILVLTDDADKSRAQVDRIANEHLREVESKIQRLQSLRKELHRMVSECKADRVAECKIINVLADHDLCLSHDH